MKKKNKKLTICFLLQLSQVDRYQGWIDLLTETWCAGLASSHKTHPPDELLFPTNIFVTCSRINALIYEKILPAEFLPYAAVSLVHPHLLLNRNERHEELQEMSVYNVKILLPKAANVPCPSVPNDSLFASSLLETRAGSPCAKTGILPSLLSLRKLTERQLQLTLGRPLKVLLSGPKVRVIHFLAARIAQFRPQHNSARTAEPSSAQFGRYSQVNVNL